MGPDIEDRFDRLPSLRWSEFERFLNNGVPARALVYPELPARARVTACWNSMAGLSPGIR